MRGTTYQLALIFLGVVATLFFGVFFYREIFPEYKIYQDDYIALEEFRSTYTGQPVPEFKTGVKQILIEREDKGPPVIDRCTSCHVAVEYPQFSPTKISRDINGNILYDAEGIPVKIPNEDDVWARLDQKITQLKASGKSTDLAQAKKYESLKTAEVGEYVYDVTKVLRMHPLMGRETRPFEYHSADNYGCVACHNGNGRGLVTDRAHGPVFDGQYETENTGYTPKFVESDPANDPPFSKVFNAEPGDRLIFQVNPLYVGGMIEAKCVQCHLTSQGLLQGASSTAGLVSGRKESELNLLEKALDNEKLATLSMIQLDKDLSKEGFAKTFQQLKKDQEDYTLPQEELEAKSSQVRFFAQYQNTPNDLPKVLQGKLVQEFGSEKLLNEFLGQLNSSNQPDQTLTAFINSKLSDPSATGTLFTKAAAIVLQKDIHRHISDVESSFVNAVQDQSAISGIQTEVDKLLGHYNKGEELYLSQACYACHKIAGFARGGVGPELTQEGKSAYPWFIKKKLVWPQGDLPTSTMPNMHFDHPELEDIITFVLAQVGNTKAISETSYKTQIQEWDNGKKLPWEQPVSPAQIHDIRFGMTVFATQGCSACHRLKGFDADIGYTIEKGKPTYNQLYDEHEWFKNLFPEMIAGSEIVSVLEKNGAEIDQRLSPNIRKGSILDEIEAKHPGNIEALYTPFRFAMRAKDNEFDSQMSDAKTPEEKDVIHKNKEEWQSRVRNVLYMFVQEYGLGRLIGPRPNWSGIYRSDEWLMEHFHNPQSHIPRSIMPVFPFDDTKFYALTYMLDVIGKKNRDSVLEIWEHKGFNPEQAVEIHCTQCHGDYLLGNGPIAQWIYPIPKNLRNADFLRNLTRERAINSIVHGVKGTPMPPWGETFKDKPEADEIPVLNEQQVHAIVDWLFSQLPGGQVIKSEQDVPKWNYSPQDVIKELKREGHQKSFEEGKILPPQSTLWTFPRGDNLWASLTPQVKASEDIIQIFDVVPNPNGPEKNNYYLKKEYYTPENIASGKAFFEENCAVCHGKEADGSGARSEAMRDAKPRMLTNLDWLSTRDDLRILRSIKYGVPGTAMTPWGDLTSGLQRLQLVMFIRSLSSDHGYRDELSSQIYQTFEKSRLAIERARIREYRNLGPLKDEYKSTQDIHQNLIDKLNAGTAKTEEVLASYQKELQLQTQVDAYSAIDQLYLKLRKENDDERALYQAMGAGLIGMDPVEEEFTQFLKILELHQNAYTYKEEKLELNIDPKKFSEIKALEESILSSLEVKIKKAKAEGIIIQGKINSEEKAINSIALTSKLISLEKLHKLLISGFQGSNRSMYEQKALLEEINSKLNELKGKKSPEGIDPK